VKKLFTSLSSFHELSSITLGITIYPGSFLPFLEGMNSLSCPLLLNLTLNITLLLKGSEIHLNKVPLEMNKNWPSLQKLQIKQISIESVPVWFSEGLESLTNLKELEISLNQDIKKEKFNEFKTICQSIRLLN